MSDKKDEKEIKVEDIKTTDDFYKALQQILNS